MTKINFSEIIKNKGAYLTKSEINSMLQVCINKEYKSTKINARNYLLILLLYRTGRRISEVVGKRPFTISKGLRPTDINIDDSLIEWDILKKNPLREVNYFTGRKVKSEKLKQDRITKKPKRLLLPIDGNLLNVLINYIQEYNIGPYDRLFKISRVRAWQIINEVAKDAGVTRSDMKIHPHMFRHSFAIRILKENPYDPSALLKIQRLLDHSNLSITQGYAQFGSQDLKDVVNKTFK